MTSAKVKLSAPLMVYFKQSWQKLYFTQNITEQSDGYVLVCRKDLETMKFTV